jgi:hypothetical protein
MKANMRTIVTGVVTVGLLVGLVDIAAAESRAKRRYQERDDLEYRYPNATPRQLQNERAYQRGEYWEKDSNALIPGTRAWFEQKEREGGDRRF